LIVQPIAYINNNNNNKVDLEILPFLEFWSKTASITVQFKSRAITFGYGPLSLKQEGNISHVYLITTPKMHATSVQAVFSFTETPVNAASQTTANLFINVFMNLTQLVRCALHMFTGKSIHC
jgi:hypothetical protein